MSKNTSDTSAHRDVGEKSTPRSDAGDQFNKEALPEKIGKNLRQIYDDVLNEPVPDDFLSLLTQADTAKSS